MEFVFSIINIVVVIIGFSAAFVNDILTFRFLKDFKINKEEQKILCRLIFIILLSLILITTLLISSIIYRIPQINQNILVTSSLLVLVIILNEMISRRIISKLAGYRIEPTVIKVNKIVFLRKFAFCLNIISVLAWVYLLLLTLFVS